MPSSCPRCRRRCGKWEQNVHGSKNFENCSIACSLGELSYQKGDENLMTQYT